jgi:hypothetical protein
VLEHDVLEARLPRSAVDAIGTPEPKLSLRSRLRDPSMAIKHEARASEGGPDSTASRWVFKLASSAASATAAGQLTARRPSLQSQSAASDTASEASGASPLLTASPGPLSNSTRLQVLPMRLIAVRHPNSPVPFAGSKASLGAAAPTAGSGGINAYAEGVSRSMLPVGTVVLSESGALLGSAAATSGAGARNLRLLIPVCDTEAAHFSRMRLATNHQCCALVQQQVGAN